MDTLFHRTTSFTLPNSKTRSPWTGPHPPPLHSLRPVGKILPVMPRPRISTNLAVSVDGKISSSPPIPSGWTSRADHDRLLELRSPADALLIGRGTLEADRMTLTSPGKAIQPLRCIVSTTGNLDPAHPIFTKPGGPIHLLVTGTENPGIPPELLPRLTLHRMSLPDFLTELSTRHGVERLHCEGGGQLIRALAELDAIDDFHLTIAGHTLFGGLKSPTATGIPAHFLPQSRGFSLSHFDPRPEPGECLLTYTRSKE